MCALVDRADISDVHFFMQSLEDGNTCANYPQNASLLFQTLQDAIQQHPSGCNTATFHSCTDWTRAIFSRKESYSLFLSIFVVSTQ